MTINLKRITYVKKNTALLVNLKKKIVLHIGFFVTMEKDLH